MSILLEVTNVNSADCHAITKDIISDGFAVHRLDGAENSVLTIGWEKTARLEDVEATIAVLKAKFSKSCKLDFNPLSAQKVEAISNDVGGLIRPTTAGYRLSYK